MKKANIEFQRVNTSTEPVYLNLVQAYEAEFSAITKKRPNRLGLFALDTPLDETHMGFIGYIDGCPFAIANIKQIDHQHYEICEYYVVPVFRKLKLGTRLIALIWSSYPGYWEIKQIEGAEYATVFWQKVLKNHSIEYEEDQYADSYWGAVTRQRFVIKNKGKF